MTARICAAQPQRLALAQRSTCGNGQSSRLPLPGPMDQVSMSPAVRGPAPLRNAMAEMGLNRFDGQGRCELVRLPVRR
jgi:hypothetical protein